MAVLKTVTLAVPNRLSSRSLNILERTVHPEISRVTQLTESTETPNSG